MSKLLNKRTEVYLKELDLNMMHQELEGFTSYEIEPGVIMSTMQIKIPMEKDNEYC